MSKALIYLPVVQKKITFFLVEKKKFESTGHESARLRGSRPEVKRPCEQRVEPGELLPQCRASAGTALTLGGDPLPEEAQPGGCKLLAHSVAGKSVFCTQRDFLSLNDC